jgi:peptide/nickel transport system permease protein
MATAVSARDLRAERWRLRLRNAGDFARRFAKRRDGVVGLAILLFFTILALFPDLLVGPLQTASTATGGRLEPPSLEYPLGTDELGRSILNLTVHGARISMVIGLMATIITIVIGAAIGIVSGYAGGMLDTTLMRFTDFFLVLPTFVLAIALVPLVREVVGDEAKIFGISAKLFVIIVVIGITSWASTARIIRSQTLSIKERAFVTRARAIGAGPGRIMVRHLLPNVVNLIVANAVLIFAGAILTETFLSFIGLGDPFAPSWGQILNNSQTVGAPVLGAWWYFVPPGFSIVLVVLSFTLLGSALDDVLNPRSRVRK